MATWTRFDTTLKAKFERASERIAQYQPLHPRAAACKALALDLLAEGPATLSAAVERAQKESQEAYAATQAARTAEGDLEDAYETLFHACNAALSALRVRDRAAGEALQAERERLGAAWTPAAFNALGLDRTLAAATPCIDFAARLLPADDPSLAATRDALATFKAARLSAEREAGEAIEATRALEHARDAVRKDYGAARRILDAAFYLDDRDDLGRFIQPLREPTSPPRLPQAPDEGGGTTPPPQA